MEKKLNSKIRDDFVSQITDESLQLFLTFHQQMKPCIFWDISKKHPRMLSACRSVIRLIAFTLVDSLRQSAQHVECSL